MVASEKGQTEIVELLLVEPDTDVNVKDEVIRKLFDAIVIIGDI